MSEVLGDGVLIDRYMPVYDIVITEHLVIDSEPEAVYSSAKTLDFMTIHTPLLSASFFVRGLPARLSGKTVPAPSTLRLATEDPGVPGWVYLGEIPGREVAFGAVGKFWKPDIEWMDVAAGDFSDFNEAGWGKIACHFLVTPDGPGRSVLSYECRTAANDYAARRQMSRYWSLIRPFVGHVMRATLRTISESTTSVAAPV